MVPLVIGESALNGGALPAYAINSTTKYVAAVGNVEVMDVFIDGITAGHSRDFEDGYTVITLNSAPAEPEKAIVTWNSGINYEGQTAGTPSTFYRNPALTLKQVLTEYTDDTLDDDGFQSAEIAQDARGLRCSFAVTKQATLRSVVESFSRSFNMTLVQARDGKLSVVAPAAYNVQAITPVIDESQIVEDSMDMGGPDDYASAILYQFSKNHALDVFTQDAEAEDQVLSSKLGEKVYDDTPLELEYVRTAGTAGAVALDRLFFMGDARTVVNFNCEADIVRDRFIGDIIQVQHYAGIGR